MQIKFNDQAFVRFIAMDTIKVGLEELMVYSF